MNLCVELFQLIETQIRQRNLSRSHRSEWTWIILHDLTFWSLRIELCLWNVEGICWCINKQNIRNQTKASWVINMSQFPLNWNGLQWIFQYESSWKYNTKHLMKKKSFVRNLKNKSLRIRTTLQSERKGEYKSLSLPKGSPQMAGICRWSPFSLSECGHNLSSSQIRLIFYI